MKTATLELTADQWDLITNSLRLLGHKSGNNIKAELWDFASELEELIEIQTRSYYSTFSRNGEQICINCGDVVLGSAHSNCEKVGK